MTEFENPETITSITAHYTTPTGRDGEKDFTTVDEYHRWERRVEAKGYDINCLDTSRIVDLPPVRSDTLADRLRAILVEWDDGRDIRFGDTDEDIARREGRADVCESIRDLLSNM